MKSRLALGLALLLAGCGKPAGGGATLRADLIGDARDAGGVPRRTIAAATRQGLVEFDGAGQVVPGLASSWRVARDGASIIFRLRPATWPDGKPVTANDAVAALRRAATPAARNPLRPMLAGIATDAPVDNVVEVRLAGAMPELLQLMAQPELAVVQARRSGVLPAPGAFRVAAAAPPPADGAPLVLERNPASASPGATALDRLVLTTVADPGAAIARFARDRTDVVTGGGIAGFSDARLLAASNALRVEPAWGVYGYVANVRQGPLADPRVRRALAMAVDRDDLGSRLFGVALTPVLGLVPPLPGAPPPPPDWASLALAARLDEARALLAAAGYSPAAPLTVTISLPEGREHSAVAAEVAADWARLGVRTQAVTRSASAHALTVARGTFDLALVERTAPADSALFFLLPFACAAKASGGGYCSPAADSAVAAARNSPDPAARAAGFAAAASTMAADTPLIALFVPIRWSLVARRVSGWTDNAAGQHPLARLAISPGRRITAP